MYSFWEMIDDVEKSTNVKDYQSPTLRCLLYISKFVLGKLNHFSIILNSVYIYIRLVVRIWMHSNIRYFFWDDKFDILCHEIILSANTQGITIKLNYFKMNLN